MRLTFPCQSCTTCLEAEATQCGTQMQCSSCGKSCVVPKAGLKPGVTLGDFVIEAQIGQGGMGTVFRARQQSMDRPVALKVLPEALSQNRSLVERFTQEIRVTARLEHPNIVTAFFAGEDDGFLYFTMSLIEGESLASRIEREGAIPQEQAIAYCLKIVDALEYAWDEHQILHRDINPANIMVDQRGEVKLLDMGIAKSLCEESVLTAHGEFIGTPNYVSPEQARGDADLDCRLDIYSLGATLYDMLTAEQPFTGKSVFAVLTKIVKEMPSPVNAVNPAVLPWLADLVNRLMSKDREDRPESYSELRGLLTQVDESALDTVVQASPGPLACPRPKRRKLWLLGGFALILLLLTLLAVDQRGMALDNRRAGRVLAAAQKQVVSDPDRVIARLEPALQAFDSRTKGLDKLQQLLADAHVIADIKKAVTEASALAAAGKSREAVATLEAIRGLPEGSPLVREVWAKMLGEGHQAVLRQRTRAVIELILAGDIESAAGHVDPVIIQQRSLPVVKIGLGLAVAFQTSDGSRK
jgi:hypothetical protein